jgi:hypothetical protein
VTNAEDLAELAAKEMGRPDLYNAGLQGIARAVMDAHVEKPQRAGGGERGGPGRTRSEGDGAPGPPQRGPTGHRESRHGRPRREAATGEDGPLGRVIPLRRADRVGFAQGSGVDALLSFLRRRRRRGSRGLACGREIGSVAEVSRRAGLRGARFAADAEDRRACGGFARGCALGRGGGSLQCLLNSCRDFMLRYFLSLDKSYIKH